MPRHSSRSRVATVLLALFYLLAWGEPVAMHACPMHDGAGVAAVHGTAGMTAGSAAHAPAHRAAAQAVDAAHVAPAAHAPASDDAHVCQCLGSGCCAAVVTVPATQQVRWFAVVTRRADPPADAPALPRARAPRHLLPPATGPPALG